MLAALPAAAGAPPWGGPWQAPVRTDHPLVGRILDARTAAPVAPAAVAERLAGARFVLLGEVHDNADAHAAQAWLLGRMVEAGRRPAVVMEMLDAAQADPLAAYLARADASAAGLGPAVDWAASGWPDWALYQPIAAVALDAGLPILPGNLPTETVRRVGAEGAAAVLGADGLAPRALDAPLPDALRADLAAEIMTGHCGMLPESALPGMIAAQRARDGEMARAMAAAADRPDDDGVVLIAGNGHVRADRAVPWYLDHLAPDGAVVTVGILEVPPDMPPDPAPADLRDTAADAGPPPYDLVLFTPAVDDVDPCEKFRDQLERLRDRHGGGTAGDAQ
ncbi:ChaN family lipoprotein [Roseospira goensis]|uniref:Putative iron-regulated protein n=1 Tax=Roseospira goensis TaxID=391922 RepID=A0A7W6WKI3_9PROT|nr:ChaN family lipoprotein [Roseospira goensis]MBB4285794.1 putative iron-regulated protein [Roseospira goensis]